MTNECSDDAISGSATVHPRRRIMAGLAMALTTAGAGPAPTVPAAPLAPTTFRPVSLGVGPSERFQRIAQALATLDGGAPLDVTLTLDPSVEHVDDTSSHFNESRGGTLDWPPYEQTVPWKATIQTRPGSRTLAVLRNSGPSLYYGKGILNPTPALAGADQTYRGIHFIGARRGDVDGRLCALWLEPNDTRATVTLEDCEIEQADTGILNGGPNLGVVLRRVYIHDCGSGSGYTHNAYFGTIASLVAEDVLSVRVSVGHLLKSRALSTRLRRVRLFDLDTGSSSYALDVPNGGLLDSDGLVIHRGPAAQNAPAIRHGEEGNLHPGGLIRMRDTTIVAQAPVITAFGAPAGLMNDSGSPVDVTGTRLFGIARDRAYTLAGVAAPLPGNATWLTAAPALDLVSPVFRT